MTNREWIAFQVGGFVAAVSAMLGGCAALGIILRALGVG